MKFNSGSERAVAADNVSALPNASVQAEDDPALGDILRRTNGLNADQVEQILGYQREHGVKFGEAAVALGLARPEDVVWALSQQFHYPYAPRADIKLNEELVLANDPFSEEVEAFRDLRSQLIMGVFGAAAARTALAVVSPNIGDGKTFMAANLAIAFSQLPSRTLIVDADLRTPRLHQIFNLESSLGLTSILSGRADPNVIKPVNHLPNLYVLPVGVVPPNPAELVQQPAFGMLLRELVAKFDYVLVDSPAVEHGADARITAAQCGAALVVGRKNRSRMPALQTLVRQLGKSSVKIAGVVMNEF